MGWSERLLEERRRERREREPARWTKPPATADRRTLVDYGTGERFIRSYQCPDCRHRSALVNRWNAQAQSYEVVCGGCGRTDGFVRHESLTQRWRRDPESVPVHVATKLAEKHGGEPMSSHALARADERHLLQRISQARWLSQLGEQDRATLARLAIEYHLDPLMGELLVYEGRPYISLAGMVRIAHEHPEFEGIEDRPMSVDEREAYGITQPIGWIAKVYRRGFRVPAVGTGAADPARPLRNNPVERERPQWLARSRAIRQALRLAFPHASPFQMEAAEERGITVEQRGAEVTVVTHAADTVEPPEPAAEAAPAEMTDAPTAPAADVESRRLDLLTAMREYADGQGPDGWQKLCRWWALHYSSPTPESAKLAELEAAYARIMKGAGR